MSSQPLRLFLPEPKKVRASFERAAVNYEPAAVLQREVNSRLLERLDEVLINPGRIADIGAGTGNATLDLARRYPQAEVVAVDIAPAMLARARHNTQELSARPYLICADAAYLPLITASIDLIFSNLTLQWCADLDQTLNELRRILSPTGLFIFTTFGPDTLQELRSAWRAVDNFSHVNAFFDLHDIGDILTRVGFRGIVLDCEHITLTYAEPIGVMNDLKTIGAHNVTQGRPRGLTGRKRIQKVMDNYEAFRREGRIPATYEIIYGHAWAGTQCAMQTPEITERIFFSKKSA